MDAHARAQQRWFNRCAGTGPPARARVQQELERGRTAATNRRDLHEPVDGQLSLLADPASDEPDGEGGEVSASP